MKAVYLDCFSGISGNMLLGAFLQAGVPVDYLVGELKKLHMADAFRLDVSSVCKSGIMAVYAVVEVREELPDFTAAAADGLTPPHHAHHTMAEIRTLLLASDLSDNVKQQALLVFQCLAEAEGKVHGQNPDEVGFHEVGAVDSIVDVVGTAICLDYLEIEKVFVSQVNTGSGFVACQHGIMMVPAPATAELLQGVPFYHKGAEKELTTPTGAAVIRAFATFAENLPVDFQTRGIAYGAGTWDLEIPNVLRLYWGEYQGKPVQKHCLLETNIDDMNPQIFGYVYERLLAAGALDVWTTPIFMKKNRPATALSVLTDEEHKEACCDLLFAETTTIGIRVTPIEQRREAVRRTARVDTPYGEVSCKISAYKGRIVSVSAEYEDCRRLAVSCRVPLKQVQLAALSELYHRLGE